MVTAYCLVRVKSDQIAEAYRKIRALSGVQEVASVYGEYDLVVKVKAIDLRALDKFVYGSLREISEVETTTTMIVSRLI